MALMKWRCFSVADGYILQAKRQKKTMKIIKIRVE